MAIPSEPVQARNKALAGGFAQVFPCGSVKNLASSARKLSAVESAGTQTVAPGTGFPCGSVTKIKTLELMPDEEELPPQLVKKRHKIRHPFRIEGR